MGRSPCCSKEGLNRGAWTAMEDRILTAYIKAHGEGKWRNLPKRAGLKRCGKSCRLRWLNYLRPDIKRGNITHDEEELIIRLHKLLGNRWSLIAGRLPGRTDNEIKNYWNTTLGKRVGAQHVDTSSPKSSKQKKRPATETKINSQTPPPPAAIRTKALRCTTKVPTAPLQVVRDSLELVNPHQFTTTTDQRQLAVDYSYYCGATATATESVQFMCSADGDFQAPNGLDYHQHNNYPFDEPVIKEWTSPDDQFLEENGTIDLGFLESFLDCTDEEWQGLS